MLGTRPDLAYAIGKLARFSSNPSQDHWDALRRVLTYLKNFPDIRLELVKGASIAPEGYVDADYANDKSNRKSTAGYVFSVSGTAFSWSSKKEPTVATSTMEAEYIALFFGSQQAAWIEQFYKQIGFELQNPIRIHCDSETAIAVAKKEESHKASKHLDVKFHSVRERIANGQINVTFIKSEFNTADVFTKSVPRKTFAVHTTSMGLVQEQEDYIADEEEEREVDAILTPPSEDGSQD